MDFTAQAIKPIIYNKWYVIYAIRVILRFEIYLYPAKSKTIPRIIIPHSPRLGTLKTPVTKKLLTGLVKVPPT